MSKIINIAEGDFDSILSNSSGNIIVDFWAPWCGPCRSLGKILDNISEKNDDITIYKINVDECSFLSEKYGISSIPTMLFFRGKEMISQTVGMLTENDIVSKFN